MNEVGQGRMRLSWDLDDDGWIQQRDQRVSDPLHHH